MPGRGLSLWMLILALLWFGGMRPAHAISTIDFLTSLSETELDAFQDLKTARHSYDRPLVAYWDAIESKRRVRRQKRSAKVPFDADDYVMSFPPKYKGPNLSGERAKKYTRLVEVQRQESPEPTRELAPVADYLAAAKRVYNFT